jgi:hypothetical protein
MVCVRVLTRVHVCSFVAFAPQARRYTKYELWIGVAITEHVVIIIKAAIASVANEEPVKVALAKREQELAEADLRCDAHTRTRRYTHSRAQQSRPCTRSLTVAAVWLTVLVRVYPCIVCGVCMTLQVGEGGIAPRPW